MKKLIIAIAAAISAAVVNAATVNWTGSAISESGSGLARTGYMAYLIDNASYAYDSVTAATLADAVSAALTSTSLKWGTSSASVPTLNPKPTDDYSNPDKPTYYMIVLDGASVADAKKFLLSDTKSNTVTSTGALSMGFGSLGSKAWVDIAPEPTSGLMMLLGMGVLALRRRRA